MNSLISILFVGGVGLSVSAIVTWLAWLSLLVFDNSRDLVEIHGQDTHIEYRMDEVESDVDKMLRKFEQHDNGKHL